MVQRERSPIAPERRLQAGREEASASDVVGLWPVANRRFPPARDGVFRALILIGLAFGEC